MPSRLDEATTPPDTRAAARAPASGGGKATVVVRAVAGGLLVVHGKRDPTDSDWQLYMDALQKTGGGLCFQLIYTLGGAPNSAQRKRSIDLGEGLLAERKREGAPLPPTAILTPSAVTRGLATLFNWFFDNTFRAFPVDAWGDAFAHAGVPEPARAAVHAEILAMRALVD